MYFRAAWNFEIFTQFFSNHEELHTMFINTSTKEFNLVNNAIPSHGIVIEHFLYYKMVVNVYQQLDNLFKNKDIFRFNL